MIKFRECLTLLIVVFFAYPFQPAVAQISYGGKPATTTAKSLSRIPEVIMPEFDPDKIIDSRYRPEAKRLKSLLFAKPFLVDIDPERYGLWEELPDGRKIWRIGLSSPGAYSLNIIFSRFNLEPGASVFVYNTDMSHVLGAFDHRNNQSAKTLALSPVKGDRVIVEMQLEKGIAGYGELVIGQMNHDFEDILGTRDVNYGRSGKCNLDINCPTGEEWQLEKHSVVRLYIKGTWLCTGVLVNNTAMDGKPYLMTANHCVEDSIAAANTVFVFGYESPFCNSNDGSVSNSLSGSKLLATQENLDFTLLRINDMPQQSFRPWYTGWNRKLDEIPINTVAIHHPQGDVKKIAVDMDPPLTGTFGAGYTPNGHWQVTSWDLGTTEDGSSGSPLFDQNGYLTGVLTGGDARCGRSFDDFFAKFALAWDPNDDPRQQLKPWLDPEETGAFILEGFNPWSAGDPEALFAVSTREICDDDNVVFTDFSAGNIETWFWNFGTGAVPATASTKGPHYVKYTSGGARTVSLTVQGPEGSHVKELPVNISVKSSELPVAGFSYTQTDLKIDFADQSEYAASYYWDFGDRRISTLRNPSNTYTTTGEYTVKQLVRNRACSDTSVQIIILGPNLADPEDIPEELIIYPVPANDFITVETRMPFSEDTVLELFSISGKNLVKKRVAAGQNKITIKLNRYPSGTYILRIVSGNATIIRQIPVIR